MRVRSKRVLSLVCALTLVISSLGNNTVHAAEIQTSGQNIDVVKKPLIGGISLNSLDEEFETYSTSYDYSDVKKATDIKYANSCITFCTEYNFARDDVHYLVLIYTPEGNYDYVSINSLNYTEYKLSSGYYSVNISTMLFESGNYKVMIAPCYIENNMYIMIDNLIVSESFSFIKASTQLRTPTNVCVYNEMIEWDTVDGADAYTLQLYEKNGNQYDMIAWVTTDRSGSFLFSTTDEYYKAFDQNQFYIRAIAVSYDPSKIANSFASDFVKYIGKIPSTISYLSSCDIDSMSVGTAKMMVYELVKECVEEDHENNINNKDNKIIFQKNLSENVTLRANYEKLEKLYYSGSPYKLDFYFDADMAGKISIIGAKLFNSLYIEEGLSYKKLDSEALTELVSMWGYKAVAGYRLAYVDMAGEFVYTDVPFVITMPIPSGVDVNKLVIVNASSTIGRQELPYKNNGDGTVTFVTYGAGYVVFTNGEIPTTNLADILKKASNLKYDGKGNLTFDTDCDFGNENVFYSVKVLSDPDDLDNVYQNNIDSSNYKKYKGQGNHFNINISSILSKTGKYKVTIEPFYDSGIFGCSSLPELVSEYEFTYSKPSAVLNVPSNININSNGWLTWTPVEHAGSYKIFLDRFGEEDICFTSETSNQGYFNVYKEWSFANKDEFEYKIRIEAVSENVSVYANSSISEPIRFVKNASYVAGDDEVPPTVPTTVAPTTVAPTTVAPTTVAPTTVAPTTVAPTTVAPTKAPTTVAPTTVAPTTVVPTTVAPTTVAPTTVAPTTVEPTTVAPTTVAPTTVAPTTVAPTTVAPTKAPTTEVPSTQAPSGGNTGTGGSAPATSGGGSSASAAPASSGGSSSVGSSVVSLPSVSGEVSTSGSLEVAELGNAVDALGVEQLVVSVKMNGNAMIPASVFEKYLGKNVLINVDVNDGTILQFSCATLTADMIKNGVYIKKQDRNFTIVLNSVDMSKNLVIYAKCDGLEVNKQTTLNFVDDNGVLTPFRKSIVFENGLTAFTVPFVGARFEVTQ